MPMSTPTPSGDRVRALRGRQGLTQAELARKADISPTTVATMETGERHVRPATVRRIARALGVSPAELFDADEVLTDPKVLPRPFDAWEVAVGKARRVREDGRERMDGLLTAWRDAKAAGNTGAAGKHLEEIGGLLQAAYDAEWALWSAGAAPTDEWISEAQEASRTYGALVEQVLSAGLGVKQETSNQKQNRERKQVRARIAVLDAA